MHQIKATWVGLGRQKKGVVITAVLAIFVSILTMSKMATSPTMTLLYADLENRAAGRIVRVLEQQRTIYEVRGGSIYVEAQLRDELRLTLASEGLPANGSAGYELLDSLSGFGTTSQMFDAAYWRAKEGELARTIVASSYVVQARVHIAQNSSNPFSRRIEPSASVSIIPSGAPVTISQANALRHLVASAVAGLSVANVAIIDANGVLIGASDSNLSANSEDERAQILRERVLRLVEARVGQGNVVVEISLTAVTETESIRKRIFDPEGRVAISTDSEEKSDNSTNASGNVTVASNLPDGDANNSNDTSTQILETRERTNFEVSETEHEILKAPGAIRRLTVAVLVNGLVSGTLENPEYFEPRSEGEMTALRDLIASAVGFDADRGDVIALKSMDLRMSPPIGTPAIGTLMTRLNLDVMALIQIGLLALVALILGLFVVRPVLSKRSVASPLELTTIPTSNPEIDTALTGEIDVSITKTRDSTPLSKSISTPNLLKQENAENSVERLRALIGERQEETVEILRGWLEEKEGNA